MEEDIINKVKKVIAKHSLIKKDDRIVIGVSGGPDSICLLNILNKLKEQLEFEIVVAHVNHMIREEADEETEYVEKMCKSMGIKCYIKKINVIEKANNEKIGTEEAGRNARYDFFEEVLKQTNSNKIATAHNANDNAETVLMNIFRGTGISGLKGIEAIRDNRFIRPLIECERIEIEKYCEDNKLNPKIDKSNFENIYTRNKVRNVVIPQLKKEFNPNIINAINKLSDLATQEESFIQAYIEKIMYEKLVIEQNKDNLYDLKIENNQQSIIIDLKQFNSLEEFLKSRVIIEIIKMLTGSTQGIEKINVEEIINLCSRNIGNKYLTPNKRLKVYVNKGKAAFIKIA